MLIFLAALLSVAYIPGITGASIDTHWAVMSMVLPLTLWRRGSFSLLHTLGLCFLAWAFLGLLWAVDPYDGVIGLWYICLMALTFWLGSTLYDLRKIFIGLSFGMAISSAIGVAQYFGWHGLPTFGDNNNAGLLYNRVVQGQVLTLLVIGLLSIGEVLPIPFLLPGIIVSGSRGAYFVLAIGIIAQIIRTPWLLLSLCIPALWLTFFGLPVSDLLRSYIWSITLPELTLFGHGPGSFASIFFIYAGHLEHPEFAHNDVIQLAFEYGIGALLLAPIVYVCLTRTRSPEWPVFLCFVLFSTFSFPLYHSLSSFLGLLVAGRLAGDWHSLRPSGWLSGFDFTSWIFAEEPSDDNPGPRDVPVVARDSQ